METILAEQMCHDISGPVIMAGRLGRIFCLPLGGFACHGLLDWGHVFQAVVRAQTRFVRYIHQLMGEQFPCNPEKGTKAEQQQYLRHDDNSGSRLTALTPMTLMESKEA